MPSVTPETGQAGQTARRAAAASHTWSCSGEPVRLQQCICVPTFGFEIYSDNRDKIN
eukprot:COSAG02_NODE_50902_length_317_cov_1.178899_1_plen_56_part_10